MQETKLVSDELLHVRAMVGRCIDTGNGAMRDEKTEEKLARERLYPRHEYLRRYPAAFSPRLPFRRHPRPDREQRAARFLNVSSRTRGGTGEERRAKVRPPREEKRRGEEE